MVERLTHLNLPGRVVLIKILSSYIILHFVLRRSGDYLFEKKKI